MLEGHATRAADRTITAMPAHHVRKHAQHRRLSAPNPPPYPPARASTFHPADPASSAAAQTPGPLPVLQASHALQISQVSDTISIDDASTERDSPPGPGDWAACGTGIAGQRQDLTIHSHVQYL
jgi:hypothetical protein